MIRIKTRAGLYGQEATELLRLIAMYPGLSETQLCHFYPDKTDRVKNLLAHLQRQARIVPTSVGRYFPAGTTDFTTNSRLNRAIQVLLDSTGRVEYHSSDEFPVKITFFLSSEIYEIIYAAAGQEVLISHILHQHGIHDGRRIVLVDSHEQLHQLGFPDITGFCTAELSGEVQCYKKTNGGMRLERKHLSQQIGQIFDDLAHLPNTLYATGTADIRRYPDSYEVLSTDAAPRAEKIACELRHLIFSIGGVKKPEYHGLACEIHGVEILYEDKVLEVTLPSPLSRCRNRKSVEFLLDPLHFYLSQYAGQNTLPKYGEYVVYSSRTYSMELPAWRVHDYDDMELKQILDILASYIMVDDMGLLCDAYNTAEFGEEDCTRIFVVPRNRFPT